MSELLLKKLLTYLLTYLLIGSTFERRTERQTSRLAETLLAAVGRLATALRREPYRSLDAERLVEHVAQQFRAVRADDAVSCRLEGLRERPLQASPVPELTAERTKEGLEDASAASPPRVGGGRTTHPKASELPRVWGVIARHEDGLSRQMLQF